MTRYICRCSEEDCRRRHFSRSSLVTITRKSQLLLLAQTLFFLLRWSYRRNFLLSYLSRFSVILPRGRITGSAGYQLLFRFVANMTGCTSKQTVAASCFLQSVRESFEPNRPLDEISRYQIVASGFPLHSQACTTTFCYIHSFEWKRIDRCWRDKKN